VIAPGQGRDKKNKAFEALREAVEPHARQGTSEDLAEESKVFTGAARTLDGELVHAFSDRVHALVCLFAQVCLGYSGLYWKVAVQQVDANWRRFNLLHLFCLFYL
jgi:hypothetical protein